MIAHALNTLAACEEAEERVRRALHDAIVDGAPVLADYYRAELAEIETAKVVLATQPVPSPACRDRPARPVGAAAPVRVNPLVVVRQVQLQDGTRRGAMAFFWCPGCDDLHGIGVRGDDGSHPQPEWEFDGNLNCPTVSPSILTWHGDRDNPTDRCHSFLRAGRWQFLADSTHALAGQTVDMVPLPDWMVSDL